MRLRSRGLAFSINKQKPGHSGEHRGLSLVTFLNYPVGTIPPVKMKRKVYSTVLADEYSPIRNTREP